MNNYNYLYPKIILDLFFLNLLLTIKIKITKITDQVHFDRNFQVIDNRYIYVILSVCSNIFDSFS